MLISMPCLFAVLKIATSLNFEIAFIFAVNRDCDFWYIRITVEKINLSDSKLVFEVIFAKGFTTTIGTI